MAELKLSGHKGWQALINTEDDEVISINQCMHECCIGIDLKDPYWCHLKVVQIKTPKVFAIE